MLEKTIVYIQNLTVSLNEVRAVESRLNLTLGRLQQPGVDVGDLVPVGVRVLP